MGLICRNHLEIGVLVILTKSSLGDEFLIWGYPDLSWINFDTPGRIDVSQGFVSGFDAENGLSDKTWISLSSTISSGNSGGGAYNDSTFSRVSCSVSRKPLSSKGLLAQ